MYMAAPALASRLCPLFSKVGGASLQAPENRLGACAFPGVGRLPWIRHRGGVLRIGGNSGSNWNLKEAKLRAWLWRGQGSRAGLEGRPCSAEVGASLLALPWKHLFLLLFPYAASLPKSTLPAVATQGRSGGLSCRGGRGAKLNYT